MQGPYPFDHVRMHGEASEPGHDVFHRGLDLRYLLCSETLAKRDGTQFGEGRVGASRSEHESIPEQRGEQGRGQMTRSPHSGERLGHRRHVRQCLVDVEEHDPRTIPADALNVILCIGAGSSVIA